MKEKIKIAENKIQTLNFKNKQEVLELDEELRKFLEKVPPKFDTDILICFFEKASELRKKKDHLEVNNNKILKTLEDKIKIEFDVKNLFQIIDIINSYRLNMFDFFSDDLIIKDINQNFYFVSNKGKIELENKFIELEKKIKNKIEDEEYKRSLDKLREIILSLSTGYDLRIEKKIKERLDNFDFKDVNDRYLIEKEYKDLKDCYLLKEYQKSLDELKNKVLKLLEKYNEETDIIFKDHLDAFNFRSIDDRLELEGEYEGLKNIILQKRYQKVLDKLLEECTYFFKVDYLNSEEKIKNIIDKFLFKDEKDKKEFVERIKDSRITFVKNWVEENANKLKLDDEQAEAVSAVGKNYLVSARAGSGKTRVLISKALFLIKHCKVSEDEILLLAFNKKAVLEIKSRLKDLLGDQMPYVKTFHALAYGIINPEREEIIYDGEYEITKNQSKFFQDIIDEYLQDEDHLQVIKNVMLEGIGSENTKFKDDFLKMKNKGLISNKKDFISYKSSIRLETLDGRRVRNEELKKIANLLFEYNLDYKYESFYFTDNKKEKVDFRICNVNNQNQGLIIQYINEENHEMKRFLEKQNDNDWKIIFVTNEDFAQNKNFEKKIINSLKENKFEIEKLTEEEIWLKIKERTIDNFTKVTRGFIDQCRKNLIDPDKLATMILSYKTDDQVEIEFYELCHSLYTSYVKRLKKLKKEDFDGLLENASNKIKNKNLDEVPVFKKANIENLKYIFIDEFQDFSKIFYNLILSIESINDRVEIFCVGDDWQAINGYAGSDLDYFLKFHEKFKNTKKLNISTNYRSSELIVQIGNALQQGNGQEAKAKKSNRGSIKIVDAYNFNPSIIEKTEFKFDIYTPLLLRIINKNKHKKIMLISRTNKFMNKNLKEFKEELCSFFPTELRENISINTAHGSKGLESDVTILLDVVKDSYPLIHPHWVFTKILGNSIEKIIAEEQRLLYVALTRAESTMYLISSSKNKSSMLDSIEKKMKLEEINIDQYLEVENPDPKKRKYILKVTGDSTFENKEDLKQSNFEWDPVSRSWEKITSQKQISFDKAPANHWIRRSKSLEISLIDVKRKEISKFKVINGKITKLF